MLFQDPFPVGMSIGPPVSYSHSKEIIETKEPVIHVLGRVQQNIDQLVPFLWILTGQKLDHPFGRW